MGNFMSPKKEEVKEAGEVIDGPVFDFIHIPSAGGAAGAIAAIVGTLLLLWFVVKRCKRHDRAARVKNLRDLRKLAGGRGGEDVEMGFEMGPMSQLASSRPMVVHAPFMQPGAFSSPFGSPLGHPALGWDGQPAIDFASGRRYQRPRLAHPRIHEIEEEEDRRRSAPVTPPPKREEANDERDKRDVASGSADRFRPDEYDWD